MWEQALVRVLSRAARKVGSEYLESKSKKKAVDEAGCMISATSSAEVLAGLDSTTVALLDQYFASPDFEEVVLQVVVSHQVKPGGFDKSVEEIRSAARDQLRLGLKHAAALEGPSLFSLVDALFRDIERDSYALGFSAVGVKGVDGSLGLTNLARVAAAAVRNSELLQSVADLRLFHEFEKELCRQVVAVDGELKLPHAGTSKSVPIESLYVEPTLSRVIVGRTIQKVVAQPDEAPLTSMDAMNSYTHLVVLGDPGAGKSTLAVKLACKMAKEDIRQGGRTPFVLVLREISADLSKGGRSVVEYIAERCSDPYNVLAPEGGVEYLLLNGRAIVVFDGLDELTDVALRGRVVRLIEGFVHKYPLVPVLVTSRRIGYEVSPLDSKIFTALHLNGFDEERVREYSQRWFDLDDSLSGQQKVRISASFMEDSVLVSDLRSNALILSMLCGMYATERYIPRNRPDVYEKCAVMLFERWDRMRGVDGHSPFGSQIRSAVQHLAWELFTKQQYGGTLSRRRIVMELAGNYYGKRYDDENDAIDEAERFLDFCTGRAWVLTDVGSTEAESKYGFSHRTFLEYFAAEHLVRSRSNSPTKVFRAVRRHLVGSEWEVVSQLAVQMVDRNSVRGADTFLGLVLAEARKDANPSSRARLYGFICRSLGYVSPTPKFIGEMIREFLALDLQVGTKMRFPSRFDFSLWRSDAVAPLVGLLAIRGGENERTIAREFEKAIREAIGDADRAQPATQLLAFLSLQDWNEWKSNGSMREAIDVLGAEYRQAIEDCCSEVLGLVNLKFYDTNVECDPVGTLEFLLKRFGIFALYVMPKSLSGGYYVCLADLISYKNSEARSPWNAEMFEVLETYIKANGDNPWFQVDSESAIRNISLPAEINFEDEKKALAALVLSLPTLEIIAYRLDKSSIDFEDEQGFNKFPEVVKSLYTMRSKGSSESVDQVLGYSLSKSGTFYAGYIIRWLNRNVDTVLFDGEVHPRLF